MASNATVDKIPHTRTLLAAIWRDYKQYAPSFEGSDLDPALANKATHYLQHEQGEDLKALLRDSFGCPDDNDTLDDLVLNLMHKHMDDAAGVPFLFLSVSKRPISRPSSRASSRSIRLNRPDTPNSIPSSPLALSFKRPFTPLASPKPSLRELASSNLATGSRGSPLASPKLLNAKASEFRPSPRPLSAAGSPASLLALRADSPSPDLWSHKSSNLAIAAPLFPDARLTLNRSTSSLAKDSFPHEDDNSDFDPFGPKPMPSFHPVSATLDKELPSNLTSTSDDSSIQDTEVGTPTTENLLPFDSLSSLFKSTLPQPEIDEALERNGYDFEATRIWIEANSSSSSIQPASPEKADQQPKGPKLIPTPESYPRGGFRARPFPRGFYRHMGGRGHGFKLCRYYLAGECMRADCRFSHDIDRALCRYWARGACAKGDSCEFLHQLPKEQENQTGQRPPQLARQRTQ